MSFETMSWEERWRECDELRRADRKRITELEAERNRLIQDKITDGMVHEVTEKRIAELERRLSLMRNWMNNTTREVLPHGALWETFAQDCMLHTPLDWFDEDGEVR